MRNGIIRNIEESLKKPLQWLICLLHCNELPFRDIFRSLDGETSGPVGFKGEIGRRLMYNVRDLPLIEFESVQGYSMSVPEDVRKTLSKDQAYLLRATEVVQLGAKAASQSELKHLKSAEPGSIHHARWLTLANRILRLYMCESQPSDEFKRLVLYIVNVYAPTWFRIKAKWKCTDGAPNFHFLLSRVAELSDSDSDIARRSLQRNCYFSHAENILLAGIVDEDESVRRKACDIVLAARRRAQEDQQHIPRVFSTKNITINFLAKSYFDMIDLNSSHVTSPPILSCFTDDALQSASDLCIPAYPCHSQGVERLVKELSRVSTKVTEHESRHGMIISAESSRKQCSKLDTKLDFL